LVVLRLPANPISQDVELILKKGVVEKVTVVVVPTAGVCPPPMVIYPPAATAVLEYTTQTRVVELVQVPELSLVAVAILYPIL
jgi:hypothetical protein